MANKRHKPKTKTPKRTNHPPTFDAYQVAQRPSQSANSRSLRRPVTFWSFTWSMSWWGFVGCLVGGLPVIVFCIGLILIDGFETPVAAYSVPNTALLLLASIPFFALAGWIISSFSLRALEPVTGPIQKWKELGALSAVLIGLLICQGIAANGGLRESTTNPYLSIVVSLVITFLTWWVLSAQFETANAWLAVTFAGAIAHRLFSMLPDVVSENPLLSFGMSIGICLLGTWAFWAMMQAAKNGTTFHGFWPQRAT